MAKHPRRPRDPNQLAKLVVEISTGDAEDKDLLEGRDAAAIKRGRKGGLKGGRARAKALSKRKRSEIAKAAAAARWGRR